MPNRDIDEIAISDWEREKGVAGSRMPSVVLLAVVNASQLEDAGYVWCSLEGRRVRCVIPQSLDLSGADGIVERYVLWAIPLGGEEGKAEYISLGLAWDGMTNSRRSAMNTTSVTLPGGIVSDSPASGATLTSLTDGRVSVMDANGSSAVLADEVVAWLSLIG